MIVTNSTLRLEGLKDLQRAFKVADVTLHKELRTTLRKIAEPVRADAERLAVSEITRMSLPWSQMRIGVTQTSVYVAPKQRGTTDPRRRRPNLAALLLGRSMLPALAENEGEIVAGVNRMLDTVGRAWEAA